MEELSTTSNQSQELSLCTQQQNLALVILNPAFSVPIKEMSPPCPPKKGPVKQVIGKLEMMLGEGVVSLSMGELGVGGKETHVNPHVRFSCLLLIKPICT